MFFGSLPKQGLKDKTAGKQIRIQSMPSSSVSQFCIDLITKCLVPSPSDRPSFEMILDEIRKANFELATEVDPSINSS
ncbi:hypothetical protein M9Y10_026427 [Tritrichomonas musculus]|uniref:Serine-threonine/tyrosine-protein kinase catalytic domain-containing protein n=1 Tax=Tritrichomonas musculus TaxID=1915356 RepID=A0ABR2H8L2_9EUKA